MNIQSRTTPTLSLPLRGRELILWSAHKVISFPLMGARRGFEEHASEPPSAQPDAAGWAGTVGMGVELVGFLSVFSVSYLAKKFLCS